MNKQTALIDTINDYIPPRHFWKYLLLFGANALIAWFFLYFGSQEPNLPYRVLLLTLGILISLVAVIGLYRTIFYHVPYKLNKQGIDIQGIGLVPWSSIERTAYITSLGYRQLSRSYSARFELRDFSFLNKANISSSKKAQITKRHYVTIVPDSSKEQSIVRVWADTYCRNLKNTKEIVISLTGKRESEHAPMYLTPRH